MKFEINQSMKRTPQLSPVIEHLETRIAPAGLISILPGGKVATWTDVDGSKATLTITKGVLTDGLFTTDQSPATGLLVKSLDLTALQFKGTAIKLTATPDSLIGGDSTVNIGYINAQNNPLGAVSISGDLGRIDAGDPNIVAKTPKAIASLTALSMGMLDGTTLPNGISQTSEVVGKVGAVKIRGSVKGVLFNVSGGVAGSIQSLTIGGSLVGTDDSDSGRFTTSGTIGAVVINGSIIGGDGQHSGSIESGGSIKSVKIVGSIFGGRSETPSTEGTGVIRSEQNIGPVTIVGSIFGGTQQDSGLISAAGNVGAVKITGGIVGGEAGTSSGGLFIGGNVSSISVKGDVLGGKADDSGVIHVAGKSGAITLLGALQGAEGEGSGAIHLGTDSADLISKLTITRDLTGGSGSESGLLNINGKLGALKIGGSIQGAVGDASGTVKLNAGAKSTLIVGDITGSSGEESGRITAAGAVGSFVISGNVLGGIADGSGSIVTTDKIDKLSITGSVIGGNLDSGATSDLVGSGLIQAQRIGALSIGNAIRVGEDNSALYSLTNNAAIRVQDDIGLVVIKGSIEGTEDTSALITARGQKIVPQDQTTDIAIAGITVGGTVRNATILAGYNTSEDFTDSVTNPVNPNAQIGVVSVSGDWIASDLVAGAKWNDNFGDGSDTKGGGVDNPDIVASIASIAVKGQIVGTGDITTDRFGFIAQQIVVMKVGPTGTLVQLNANIGNTGNDNDPASLRYNLAGTGDVRVFEFA